jgi:hypothetical protein
VKAVKLRSLGAVTLLALSLVGVGGSAAGLSGCTLGGDHEGCCKVCRTGKACGDTCISRSYECHVGSGCACNG